ncbi:MAG: hypothetical protein EBX36_12055 [Planctomycetia bacterium]|nr:hypothetical protein [Planctomycetia bacterium]
MMLALGLLAAAGTLAAADMTDVQPERTDPGSSSRESRRGAIEAFPWDKIPEPQRKAIEPSLRAATLYRRLPVETIVCDAELLEFALAKPEAIVDIWRVLGISRLALDPVGPRQWRLSDGYGTVGMLRLVHQERRGDGGLLVLHGRGAYTGPLSPKNLTGSCVLLVRHGPAMPTVDGRARQTIRIDSFLDMDGVGLEIVTRTLQPIIVRSAAANLHEVFRPHQSGGGRPAGGPPRADGRRRSPDPGRDRQACRGTGRRPGACGPTGGRRRRRGRPPADGTRGSLAAGRRTRPHPPPVSGGYRVARSGEASGAAAMRIRASEATT